LVLGEELEALFNKPIEEAATEVAPGAQDKSVTEDSLPKSAKSAKKRG
ncbi:unnamed protein product, partial [marine sediment metagenome]